MPCGDAVGSGSRAVTVHAPRDAAAMPQNP